MNHSTNNIFIAAILSLIVVISFQFFYEKPKQEALRTQQIAHQVEKQAQASGVAPTATSILHDRSEVVKQGARVSIATPELAGSINLKGARIDDLSLLGYRETMDEKSPFITLLSPSGSAAPHMAYYAEFNWLADSGIEVPNADTVWTADSKTLTPERSVKLSWKNAHGLVFERTIAVDDKAMFTVTDRVTNGGTASVKLYPFGLVARQGHPADVSSVVHEGGLGVIDGKLVEHKYKDLLDGDRDARESRGGWLGISDKYWLVAMVPPQGEKITAQFAYNRAGAVDQAGGFFQTDFRGAPMIVDPGVTVEHASHLFAGAKRVNLLDEYAAKFDIPHFDKAIDFGWFYFLTRPFLYLLELLAGMTGGLAVAILLFTVLLKLATLPLSQKSYHSMAKMKMLQPEMEKIKERFPDDNMRQSQEMMELYKREKISPMSGCVPMLIQIPIFFALYKVLYVNIEMRHAPFYGWIKDMSVADPTNMFTLFGTFDWTLPALLHVGAWPLFMGISMFLQQKLSPQPADKSQARMFMFMPLLFTFMLAHMPAGLVIYWTWSNLLGIAQQWYIMKSDERRKAKAA